MIGINLELKSENDKIILYYNGERVASYIKPTPTTVIRDIQTHIRIKKYEIDEDLLIYNVNQYFIDYNPPKKPRHKNQSSESIPCPICGGAYSAYKRGLHYRCDECKNEFNEDGSYTKPPWFPEPNEDEIIQCTPIEAFNSILEFWKTHIVYQDRRDYLLDTLLTMQTYFMDEFDTTGYRGYKAAGNEKGKSVALIIFKYLAYRAVLSSRPTDAFVLKVLEDGGCILLDQAEDAFYKRDEKTKIYNIFTSGYTRDIPMGQLSAIDHVSYEEKSTFGFKAFNQQEDGRTDNPINSRTWITHMQRGVPKNKKIDKQWAKKNRYMMHYLKKNLLRQYDGNTDFDNRAGQMYDPVISIIRLHKLLPNIEEEMSIHALEFMDKKTEESADTLPAAVVQGISATLKNEIQPKGITTPQLVTEWIIKFYPDQFKKLHSGHVGRIITQMGLRGVRQNIGKTYNILNDMKNLEAYEKARSQYKPDSISAKLSELENEFKEMEAKIDFVEGSEYERFYKLKKYKELIALIHKEGVESSNINVDFSPPEEYEPENLEEEAFKQHLESLIDKGEDL